ncbi:DUF6073 family protein [Saccharothrix syringae]|uniref:Uncharacterized protein n=1 Tax=Saccharothrix syringae TaxID=103733 RepID=A0A5Q0GXS2_SACSY|nr:DUF6073 family protein [Saccharothrix syringae]QFZ18314.1 hypothetical protein EKG83_13205 [Saccharothrix syringae]
MVEALRAARAVTGADGSALSNADIVKGHDLAWGGPGNLYTIRPYTLGPAALEVFTVRERIHVLVDGLGEDLVDLHGVGVYRRHEPRIGAEGADELTWTTATIGAQFLSLQVVGDSEVLGQVRVTNTPGRREGATVAPARPGGGRVTPLKNCVTLLFPRFEIEHLGATVDTGDEPVAVESRVNMVPPIGDVSRTSRGYALYDGDRRVGTLLAADLEIGALLHHIPIQTAKDPVEAYAVTAE